MAYIYIYVINWTKTSLVQIMACHLFSTNQAITRTNAGLLLIGPFGTNFSQTWVIVQRFSFKTMKLKMSSVKWEAICLGLNVLPTYRFKSWRLNNQDQSSHITFSNIFSWNETFEFQLTLIFLSNIFAFKTSLKWAIYLQKSQIIVWTPYNMVWYGSGHGSVAALINW